MTARTIAYAQAQPRRLINPVAMLVVVLAATMVMPVALFTAFLAALMLAYLPYTAGRANAVALRLALPFLFITAYALLLAGHNDRYEMFKDAWYTLKLCLCLMLGFLIGIRLSGTAALLRVVVAFAVIASIWAVAWFFSEALFAYDPFESEFATRAPLVTVAAIPILLELLRPNRVLHRALPALALALLLAAVAVSNSRITIIAAIAMFAAWAGLFSQLGRTIKGGLVLATVLFVVWQLLPDYPPGDFSLPAKFRRSLDEIMFTDAYDSTAMIWNWRGFEAYNAQLMFDQSSFIGKVLGNGLGATVDLGQSIEMGENMTFQFLPTLHNGYYYVLIKYGVVGVLVYVLAVLSWALGGTRRQAIDPNALEERIIRGLIATVLLTTTVITGLFNRDGLHATTLIIAALIGIRWNRLRAAEPRPRSRPAATQPY